MSSHEFCLSQFTEESLWPDTKIFIILNKESELTGEITIVFVIRSSRQQDASAFVFQDILMD